MKPLVVVSILLLLALPGCADQGGPNGAPTDTAAAPATPTAVVTTGSPALPDAPSATSPAELEAAIRATAPDYNPASVGSDDAGKARYVTVRKDLNADGADEIFVYLMGPYFCGSGGCTLLIFDQGVDGYSLLANIATSSPPVIVATSTTNGYADVWRMQSGGGAPAEYVQHVFNDGKYVEQSRRPAEEIPGGTTVLAEDTDFADGLVLEPRE